MAQQTAASKNKAAWKKARRHTVTLPSGFVVEIEVPNLALLVKTGYLPNELVTQALGVLKDGVVTPEVINEQPEFYAKLAKITVKSVDLEYDDVIGDDAIPYEDVEMIIEFATRQRDLDAVGHHLGGLHTVKEWQTFRNIEHLYEALAGDEGSRTALS